MTFKRRSFRLAVALVPILGVGRPLPAQSATSTVSGIIRYTFDPNPKEIKPKMYNWEIRLNEADSKAGAYAIVQVTRPTAGAAGADSVNPVIDSKVIVPGQDLIIDFNLYVGDKTPKENMGRQGNSGEPVIFSGVGTGNGASSWVVFPGATIERATPSPAGTPLRNGKLTLIRYLVRNARGTEFQTDVILQRK